jgi:hypothetical protein
MRVFGELGGKGRPMCGKCASGAREVTTVETRGGANSEKKPPLGLGAEDDLLESLK